MKKFLLLALCAPLVLGGGCNDYDDQPLKNRIDGLEERIEALEQLCKQANTNIASLQTLVETLQNNDYVQSVAPIVQNGKTIGYTITFTKSGSITIYHGTDGTTPVVGVKEWEGAYYWTLNDEWLTGPDGQKIKAEGEVGTTPQMKIEEGHWWVSSDNGATWKDMGAATGEDGDSFFQDVKDNPDAVVLILANGTQIEIPKVQRLAIVLDAAECALTANTPVEVGYTLTGAGTEAETQMEILSSGVVKAKITATDATSGRITLVTEDPEGIDEYTKVLIFASDGIRTAMAAITFEQGVLHVAEAYEAEAAGGQVTVPVETNLAYEVAIEASAQSWLSQLSTRAVRTDNLVFRVEPNDGADRTGTIVLTAGELVRRVCISQQGGNIVYEIELPTDFSTGDVQKVLCGDRQVAEICNEYIRSGEYDGRMIVVYPMVGGKADLTRGFLPASGGASVVWDTAANTCTVTAAGSDASLQKFYLTSDGFTAELPADSAPLATTSEADLLIDVRGAETQTYKTVKIGTQYWMAENLRAERYADGSTITVGTWTSSVSKGYCVYLFESPGDYKATYGALYNGYALLEEAGLAPAGWEIPDNTAWTQMYTYIGGKANAVKLKSTETWNTRPGTNITGFNAYAGMSYGGNDFVDSTLDTWYWSNNPTTDFGRKAFFYVRMTDTSANIIHTTNSDWANSIHTVEYGHYIRCIKK